MLNNSIKKKQKNNILLNILFKAKNIYGERLNESNKDLLPFIFGVRYNYTIINLKNVSSFLKIIFKLIKYTLQKKKKILFIGNSIDINFLVNIKFIKKNKNIFFLSEKNWINGSITNKIDKELNSWLKENKINLIFILKSDVNENFLNQELMSLKIPVVSIINTNNIINNITYPIVTNSKNIQSLYIIMYLLRKIF
jgi:ribosomal protein S2